MFMVVWCDVAGDDEKVSQHTFTFADQKHDAAGLFEALKCALLKFGI